ncbi:MAG: amino acid transporter substrate-binding protein family [Betaproteobacteria bacterium]|nr:amino acid transporter substrate-binding protein family [Betaproteobacteria bacterium]
MNRITCITATIMLAATTQFASALTFLTEENPPLNFTKNGQIAGTATAVVEDLLRRSGLSADFRVMPWNDAYARAQADPGACVYATARLPERYRLFQWVGPIARGVYSAFALTGFKDKVGSAGDLFKYRVGVAQDARGQYLRRRGFINLVEVERDADIPAMLTLNRTQPGGIDIWVTQAEMARSIVGESGGAIKEVFPSILTQEYWLACNLKMPPEQVRALSNALSEIEKIGAPK